MRDAFAEEMTALARTDPRVVLLSGDIGNRLFDAMKLAASDRVLNCGVAEQNMIGVAAGMALSGLRPVVYTITPFATCRCFEQIRVDLCYHEAPVVIVGTGSGLAYASLGPTHHSLEDVAILRTLPGMTVFCPADPMEVRLGLRAALTHKGPVYIRLGKKGEPSLHPETTQIELGRAVTMRAGDDVCLIGTGSVVGLLLDAAERLAEIGVSARVENFHTIKPLDVDRLKELSGRFDHAVVMEEHGRIGGLYGAIAEWISDCADCRLKLTSISAEDKFLHQIGNQDFARRHFGITADAVVQRTLARAGVRPDDRGPH